MKDNHSWCIEACRVLDCRVQQCHEADHFSLRTLQVPSWKILRATNGKPSF